jgi:hypothetical protein
LRNESEAAVGWIGRKALSRKQIGQALLIRGGD